MIDFDVLNWNQRLDQISCERQLLNANIWTKEYCIWLHLIIGDYSQNHLEENGIPICNAIISFYDSVRRASSKKYQGNTFADKCIEYDKWNNIFDEFKLEHFSLQWISVNRFRKHENCITFLLLDAHQTLVFSWIASVKTKTDVCYCFCCCC